jgi:hypothetical protein
MEKRLVQILTLVFIEFVLVGCQIKSKNVSDLKNTPPKPVLLSPVQMTKTPLNFSSLVKSLIAQAEITNAAEINNIYTVFNTQKNQLPQTGAIAELNPSAMGTIFVVAGQVCGALKNKELALADSQRKAFRGFGFSPAATVSTVDALVSQAAIRSSADALSQMFLGRPATEDEKLLFIRTRDQVLLSETITATNNRKLVSDIAVSLCTGVASSLEAISM